MIAMIDTIAIAMLALEVVLVYVSILFEYLYLRFDCILRGEIKGWKDDGTFS